MKKMPITVDNIKNKILELKGQDVELYINRGRRKVSQFRARIEDCYTSVFTVKSFPLDAGSTYTYSYNDILCGDVKIQDKENA